MAPVHLPLRPNPTRRFESALCVLAAVLGWGMSKNDAVLPLNVLNARTDPSDKTARKTGSDWNPSMRTILGRLPNRCTNMARRKEGCRDLDTAAVFRLQCLLMRAPSTDCFDSVMHPSRPHSKRLFDECSDEAFYLFHRLYISKIVEVINFQSVAGSENFV